MQNQLLKAGQKQLHWEVNGDLGQNDNAVPKTVESKKFWW